MPTTRGPVGVRSSDPGVGTSRAQARGTADGARRDREPDAAPPTGRTRTDGADRSPVPGRSAGTTRAQTGRLGEDLAAGWAAARGWRVVDRNWRHGRAGEIDLVALDGDELVAVEVKTRRGSAFGHPAEAVTAAKVARLRRLVAAWLATHDLHPVSVRIDVLAVTLHPHDDPRVEHLQVVV